MFKPNFPPRLSITCSASPLRSRPWSTKIDVNWSPIAFVKTPTTLESTPPERPSKTFCHQLVHGFFYLHIDKVIHCPVTFTVTNIKRQSGAAIRFRIRNDVLLHGIGYHKITCCVLDRSNRTIFACSDCFKAFRNFSYQVTMAHPYCLSFWCFFKQDSLIACYF